MPREYSKLVVWPREPQDGPEGKVYRYPIVGMIVSDTPIEGLEGKVEVVIDGETMFFQALEAAPMRSGNPFRFDANGVITNLNEV